MKNFIFKSRTSLDLNKIFLSLEIMKKQNRDLRDDLIDVKKRLTQLAHLMTAQPSTEVETEYPEEELESR